MDGWQAVQNWAIFGSVVVGLGYYYYGPKGNAVAKASAPVVKDTKKEAKKPARKLQQEKAPTPSVVVEDALNSGSSSKESQKTGSQKRKANTKPGQHTAAAAVVEQEEDVEIDDSVRQFAQNMLKAREGIQVKSTSRNDTRVKTVKPKSSLANTQMLSSGSSQADGEEEWPPAVSPAIDSNGIDDMLEPVAAGPSSLRITASEKPVREKVNKPAKKEPVETKKQRQNRRKVEEKRLEREAEERAQKAKAENQRRTAREARGEPAKNGIPIAAAPVNNPWAEQNATRDAHNTLGAASAQAPVMLDTFDAESNSSSQQSNAEISSAATSTTDAAPARWQDDVTSGEDDYSRAIQESEQETGWSEVKSSKKQKKKGPLSETNGNTTPKAVVGKANARPTGFEALGDTDLDA